MKRILKSTLALALVLSALFALTACSFDEVWSKMPWNKDKNTDTEALWEGAIYQTNTTLGNGKTTLTVKVEENDKSVTFTIKTDKETVGAALLEHNLIEGEDGAYGLYVKKVNGIVADYDVDQSYWAFYVGDEYAMSGVDSTEIQEGALYRLVYTK
ncbi:MAG: DUF4430 domain-containing protein [Ruminococcaceae bacterium]|nr:DUF4430 domain-containing protein [Oscillospiraceae bacterium]